MAHLPPSFTKLVGGAEWRLSLHVTGVPGGCFSVVPLPAGGVKKEAWLWLIECVCAPYSACTICTICVYELIISTMCSTAALH